MRRRGIWIVLGVLMLLAVATTVAQASGDIAPLAQDEDMSADALWVTLAPLIAIATFAERVLEVFWERWERAGLWPNRAGQDTSVTDYVPWKRVRSHWLGTLVAVIAIGLTNVRLFRLLGFDVLFSSPGLVLFNAGIGGILDNFTLGTLIDWAMTAGIVGWGGTELTHNVIEGLVKGRGLWKEMREVEAGERSIADVKFFNEYVVPQLEERGVSVPLLRRALETLDAAGVPVNEFIGRMTVGKVDEFIGKLEDESKRTEVIKAVRTLLDGVPDQKRAEIPNVFGLINTLSTEQRKRFLGV